MKLLRDILLPEELTEAHLIDWDLEIAGITDHSAEVAPGFAFVGRRGTRTEGSRFIPQALEKGAKLIIREDEVDRSLSCPQIKLRRFKEDLGKVLSRFHDEPERALILVGITGTNGKTSATFFVKEIAGLIGLRAGYVGSLFYDIGKQMPSRETTPSSFTLFPLLKASIRRGLKLLALEVSSHALDQDRIFGLAFDACGFTNLSRDHLDYHRDMESYFRAKKKLFTGYLKDEGTAVISLESQWGVRLYEELKVERPKIKLTSVNDEHLFLKILDRAPYLRLRVEFNGRVFEARTNLVGDFQAKNLGVALGILNALGAEFGELISALPELSNPPGRLELVGSVDGSLVFVDYAHTPDALRAAIESLLPLRKGRFFVVFGCGGNRDQGKRPLMGEVAEALADVIILTSDNPRDEDPVAIIEEIKRGLKGVKPTFVWVDRETAIWSAVKMLEPGDILLIAGKGHEDYQEIQGQRIPFSDRRVAEEAVRGR